MSEWKEVKLGDYTEFNPYRKLRKGDKAKKITMDMLIPHSKQIYDYIVEPYNGGAKFQNGDTIMARITPCLENGKHAYINILGKDEIAYGSTEYIVLCGKADVTDNEFVYYFSHSPIFKNTAIKSMVGSSGRQRAQTDVLKELVVNIPISVSEQKEIAGILSSLDAKIETNNKLNEKLEEMAQAIFKSWFVDFEPFKDKPFHETELGMIPEGWEVGSLSDIATITMGQSPCGTSYNENGEGIIFYQGRTEFGFRFPSIRLYTTAPSRFAEVGSTLMSVRAPVGDINMSLLRCCIGRGVASIKSNCDCDSYIYYLMKSLKKRFDIYNGEGTVFGSVGRDTLRGMLITIPPSSVISDFEMNISKIDSRIKTNELESQRLASLRDTLLPRLMSGELIV